MAAQLSAQPAPDMRPASPAVDRALTLLETLVSSEEPMTLTALARAGEIPIATCAAILQTLEMRGYAARRVVGRSHFWRPTLRLNGLAAQLVRKIDLVEIATPHLRQLVDQLGMPAHVGILEGDLVIYAAKVAAPGMVQFDTYPGKTAPFNLTALGRAIAAYVPEDQLRPHLRRLAAGRGPRAHAATAKGLLEELASIRERGYALELEEEDAGVGCVAVTYFDGAGHPVGSVGVTGFADRFQGDNLEQVAAAVRDQADQLGRELLMGTDDGVR